MNREIRFRNVLSRTIAGALAGSLIAMGTSVGAQTLGVAWWGEGDQNKRTQEALDAFTAESGVKIVPQATNYAGYFERLATQVAAGNAPDVFQMTVSNLAEYAGRGTLAELDEYYGSVIDTSDWPEVARASADFNGHQYFVPMGLASYAAIILDKTVVDELGLDPIDPDWTMADFREYAGAVAEGLEAKSGKDAWGTDDFGGSPVVYETYLRSLGKELFTPDGELGFTEEDLTNWLTYWDELRKDGIAVPPQAQESGGFETSPLVRGVAPIVLAYSSKGIQGYAALTDHELAFIPFPKADENSERVTLVAPVEWMAVSVNSENVADAAALLGFLANDTAAFDAMGVAKGAPVGASLRKQKMESGTLSEIEMLIYQNVEEALPYSRPRNTYPAGSAELLGVAGSLLDRLNEQVGLGDLSIDDAVRRFFAESRRALR
jgi:multiple sugar transport system substrate-binding protein